MARGGYDGFGVVLEREETPGLEDYESIAHITTLTGPSIEREQIDITSHDSPDQWEEFVFGIKRSGEVSADINYDPSAHDHLMDDFNSSEPRRYRITWPDDINTTWTFDAGLVGFEPEAPYDDKLSASVTWKVSGPPVFGTAES